MTVRISVPVNAIGWRKPSAPLTPRQLGARMRAEREDAGLTQKDVARRLCVKVQTVRNWECGSRVPGVLTLDAYMRVVNRPLTIGPKRW